MMNSGSIGLLGTNLAVVVLSIDDQEVPWCQWPLFVASGYAQTHVMEMMEPCALDSLPA